MTTGELFTIVDDRDGCPVGSSSQFYVFRSEEWATAFCHAFDRSNFAVSDDGQVTRYTDHWKIVPLSEAKFGP